MAATDPHRSRTLAESFRHAWNGLLFVAGHQRSMKIHIVAGLLVALVACAVPLGVAEKVTLIFCVTLVLFAEILNASLEALVNLHTERFHPEAKITKDAAAAGVLVLAFGTVIIFAALIVHNWPTIAQEPRAVMRQVAFGIPAAIVTSVLLASFRRPVWADYALCVIGAALLLMISTWTTSIVFTGVTFGLFGLSCLVAKARHNDSRAVK